MDCCNSESAAEVLGSANSQSECCDVMLCEGVNVKDAGFYIHSGVWGFACVRFNRGSLGS